MSKNLATTKSVLTYADIEKDPFSGFKNDKERIKYMSNAYKKMNIVKAFEVYYNMGLSDEIKHNKSINTINSIELGNIYSGTVKSFTGYEIEFELPGVKESIICKENFHNCMDHMNLYLSQHNNKLLFQVREKKNNVYYVSVIEAYYQSWLKIIEKAIWNENAIEVHIDSLINGGYMCHTVISTLKELTGKDYTNMVFIPGSHIVLNIEHDFNKWIGKDVLIVPQKFVNFIDYKTGVSEKSCVGSRKRVLQILGMQNLENMYNTYMLTQKENVKVEPETYEGVVTGIINANNKTGIFIEIEDKCITGLAPVESYDLLDYKPGMEVKVQIDKFESKPDTAPFVYNKKGILTKCFVRPIFRLV